MPAFLQILILFDCPIDKFLVKKHYISAGSEAGNRTTNVVQVQNISGVGGANRVNVGGAHRINMGGASRPVGVARSTSVQAVRTGVTGNQVN